MKKTYYIFFMVILISPSILGQIYYYYDRFDLYIAGQLLALQNPTDWTTWSNSPGGIEDPLVSNVFAATFPNSVVIKQYDDLIRLHDSVTSGWWQTTFMIYIPSGKSGYFSMLSDFNFGSGGYWAFECYFDVGGGGRLLTGDGTTIFNWTPNTWQWVEVVIDLDLDQTEFWIGGSIGGTLVHSWTWTNGVSPGTGTLTIEATNFYGETAFNEMYIDNYIWDGFTPVELTSFTATSQGNSVLLNWSTASEINNSGFDVERKSVNSDWKTIGFVQGNGTTTETKHYTFSDLNLNAGNYSYRLKQIDFDGTFAYSNIVEADISLPSQFELVQNYPNPFNPSTRIQYNLPEAGNVKLTVFNLLGQEVKTLVNEFMEAGSHTINFNAEGLNSGIYLYRVEANGFSEVRKMTLIK